MKAQRTIHVTRHIRRLACFAHPTRPKKETIGKCQKIMSPQSKPFCSIHALIHSSAGNMPSKEHAYSQQAAVFVQRDAYKCNVHMCKKGILLNECTKHAVFAVQPDHG